MNRPQPRKSALSNLNPIQPPRQPEPESAPQPPTPKTETKKTSTSDKQRVTLQISTEVLEYARGAYTQDLAAGSASTWSAWVENALKLATEESNTRNGNTARPIPTGVLPRGVPAGTSRTPK